MEELLLQILDQLKSDEYEQGPTKTLGGPTGNYIVRSPYNTECEWCVIYASGQGPAVSASGGTLVNSITTGTVLNLASAARASYSSGTLSVAAATELAVDFNVTALTGGTGPTVTFKVSRLGADGVLYQLVAPATPISAAGTISYSLSASPASFGGNIQIDMVTTGAPTSITFSGSVISKTPQIYNPSIAASLQGQIALSSNDSSVFNMGLNPTLGLSSSGEDNNAFDGLVIPLNSTLSYIPAEIWQPLGRGANIYIGVTAPTGGNAYVQIAFRRKLDHQIPAPPRRQPHAHTITSRRTERTFTQGFADQYVRPGSKYSHNEIPEDEDNANIGYVENQPKRRSYRHGR